VWAPGAAPEGSDMSQDCCLGVTEGMLALGLTFMNCVSVSNPQRPAYLKPFINRK
jgi:hypothetical protein